MEEWTKELDEKDKKILQDYYDITLEVLEPVIRFLDKETIAERIFYTYFFNLDVEEENAGIIDLVMSIVDYEVEEELINEELALKYFKNTEEFLKIVQFEMDAMSFRIGSASNKTTKSGVK